jgi:hypothetical protein
LYQERHVMEIAEVLTSSSGSLFLALVWTLLGTSQQPMRSPLISRVNPPAVI